MMKRGVESTSRFRGAAIQRTIVGNRTGQPFRWVVGVALLGAAACGGQSPNADPLASIAESVSAERRSPPPLVEAWRLTPESALTLRPAVGANNVYLALGSELVALNAADGQPRWSPIAFDSPLSAAPVAGEQQVVVASRGAPGGAPPPRLYWFDDDGNLLRQLSLPRAAREISAAPGAVVYISDRDIGRVGAAMEWSEPVEEPQSIEFFEPLDLALVSTADGRLLAFDGSTGRRRWEFAAAGAVSRPHVSENRVFIGTADAGVISLDAESGEEKWSKRFGTAITGAPAVAGDLLWVGAQDAKLRALKASNGTEMEGDGWRISLSSRNYLDIVAFERWIVVGPAYGPWMAVRAPTRFERRQSPTGLRVRRAEQSGGTPRADLTTPAGSGPAGVAVVNNDGSLVFLRPQVAR